MRSGFSTRSSSKRSSPRWKGVIMQPHKPIPFPLDSSGPIWNRLDGHVVSILHGLTRTTVKLLIEDEVVLTVRCSSEQFEPMGRVGHHVTAQLNAYDVLLGTTGTSLGKERWNRWSGRIVLVGPGSCSPLITVKLQGKGWILKSMGPVVGQPGRRRHGSRSISSLTPRMSHWRRIGAQHTT